MLEIAEVGKSCSGQTIGSSSQGSENLLDDYIDMFQKDTLLDAFEFSEPLAYGEMVKI